MALTHTLSVNELLKTLALFKTEARKRYKADIRGVFGSYVRGEQRPESDIDVLVEFDDGANLLDLTGLALFLEEKLNRHVDVVPESSLRTEIKEGILREVAYL